MFNVLIQLIHVQKNKKENKDNFTIEDGSVIGEKIIKEKDEYKIMNGNILVSKLKPDYAELDNSLNEVSLSLDGKKMSAKMGAMVTTKNSFQIDPINGYRINIIGYSKTGVMSEGGLKIEAKDIVKSYAIDKAETTYMVQFYKDKKFCGMITIKFDDDKKAKK